MIRRMVWGALVGAVLVVGLAACSDDGGDDDIVLEDIDGSGRGDDTTTTDGTDDEGDGDDTSTTLGGGVFAEGCAEFSDAFEALGASIGAGGEFDSGVFTDFEEIVQQAPAEVREHLLVYLEAFRDYAEALEAAGIDPNAPGDVTPEAQAQLAELTQIFSTPEFLEATQGIQDFVSSNCEG